MMCFETGLAALLDIKNWIGWATIVTPMVAIGALLFAKKQLDTSRNESRRASAYAAYESYLQLCFDYPKFSYGFTESTQYNQDAYDQYRWFIAKMLFAFEQVLDVYKEDEEWKTTIRHQLKRHKWHLNKSRSAKRNEWTRELTVLIEEAIGDSSLSTEELRYSCVVKDTEYGQV